MKIWRAKLVLVYGMDGEWLTNFDLKKDNNEDWKDYEEQYRRCDGWIGSSIPKQMLITQSSCDLIKCEQGFNYKPSEEELKVIKSNMKEMIISQLEYDKQNYLQSFKDKIEVLNDEK